MKGIADHRFVRSSRVEIRGGPRELVRQVPAPAVATPGLPAGPGQCDTYPTSDHGVAGLQGSGGESG